MYTFVQQFASAKKIVTVYYRISLISILLSFWKLKQDNILELCFDWLREQENVKSFFVLADWRTKVLKLEVLGSNVSVLSGLWAKNRSQLFKSCLRLKPIIRQILELGKLDFSIITSEIHTQKLFSISKNDWSRLHIVRSPL